MSKAPGVGGTLGVGCSWVGVCSGASDVDWVADGLKGVVEDRRNVRVPLERPSRRDLLLASQKKGSSRMKKERSKQNIECASDSTRADTVYKLRHCKASVCPPGHQNQKP